MLEPFLLMPIFFACLIAPSFLARRGVGNRRVWLVAGALGLLVLYIFSIRPYEHKMDYIAKNRPAIFFTHSDPEPLPFGELTTDCLIAGGFGLMLAGLVYKPNKDPKSIISTNADRSIPHAGR